MFLFYQCLQSPPRPSGEVWFLHSGIFWQSARVPTYHKCVPLEVATRSLGIKEIPKGKLLGGGWSGEAHRALRPASQGFPTAGLKLPAGQLPSVSAPPAPHLHAQPRHAERPPRHAGPGSCRAGGRVVRERRGRRPARGREEEGRGPTERGKGGRKGASSQPVAGTHR